MSDGRRRRELARADRVLPGLWRLRLPLPWPGVPHVNAWAIAAGSGVVLVDTGLDEPGALRQVEHALDEAGLRLEHVRLLVCTHAHSDHYGLAGPILREAECELWMHPNHQHLTRAAADPERMLERRIEWQGTAACPPTPSRAMRRSAATRASGWRRSCSRTRSCCPASRCRPPSATGRCTRRPATPRPTSSSTSRSGGCCSREITCSAGSPSTTTTATP